MATDARAPHDPLDVHRHLRADHSDDTILHACAYPPAQPCL